MQDRQTKGEREDEFEKGDYGSQKQGGIRYIQQKNCSWREGVCIVVLDPEPSSRFLRQRNVVVARFARPLRGLLGHTNTVVSHDTVDQNSWM